MYENWWKEDPPRVYEFAIMLKKENGKMIGNCGLYMDDEKRATAMLGWYIHRDYWNQGYATEAVKALLKFGFEDLELHRIHAECNTDNIASARVMEKVGMRREGHFIKNRFDRVGDRKMWYSEFFYGILREEYLNKQPLYGGKEARLMDFLMWLTSGTVIAVSFGYARAARGPDQNCDSGNKGAVCRKFTDTKFSYRDGCRPAG